MISHGLNSSLPPRFYELGSPKFQELCADLLAQDQRYTDSQVYGRNGQAQRGIDILATLTGGSEVDVGQCKCWESTTPAKIRAASDEFFAHLDHWKQQGLKRFILFAACPIDDTKPQDQILTETRRFKDRGIVYEVWDARKLLRHLRPYPHVVRTHIQDQSWVKEICGTEETVADATVVAGTIAIVRRQGLLVTELAGERNKELERVRELAAEGKGEEALRQIVELQQQESWLEMPEEIRAKALRIQASLTLNVRNDLKAAQQLLAKAKTACPSANTRALEAMFAYNSTGPQAALDFLIPPLTTEEWNIRLQMFLELGQPDEAIAESVTPPAGGTPTTETAYARSLALLLNRQVEAARAEILQALTAKPTHFSLRYAAAVADYCSTVSISFPAWGHLTWPVPPDWNLIKRDPASVEARRSAANAFHELCALAPNMERDSIRIWELACVSNEPERQEEAQKLAQTLLHDSPAYPPAIVWAGDRGYEFDHKKSVEALRRRIEQPTATQEEIETLAMLLANTGRLEESDAVLNDNRAKFVAWDALHTWSTFKIQCLCALGQVDEATKLVESEPDTKRRQILKTLVLRSSIPKTKDVQAVAKHLEAAFQTTQDTDLLLNCCEAKARTRDWEFIANHAERLVSAISTEGVLRLAVQATFNCNRFDLTRTLLEKYSAICSGGKLPIDLRRLLAECLRQEGRVPQAVAELEKLAQEKPEFANLAQLFHLQQFKGDLPASVLTARKFLDIPDVPAEFLLKVAPVVRLKDPALASKLWEKAVETIGDDPALKVYAAFQSFTLGIESKATNLLKEFPALAQSGKAPIKALGVEEIIESQRSSNEGAQKVAEQYSKGFIPLHLLPGPLGITLARLILGAVAENSAADYPRLCPPLFIRYAGRASQLPVPIGLAQKVIYLDVTSVLLFHGFDLLDLVEQCFETIVVSGNLANALTYELDKLTHHQPNLLTAKRAVLALLDTGKLKRHQPDEKQRSRDDDVGKMMGDRWCAWLDWSRTQDGLMVEHSPLMSNVLPLCLVTLPPDDAKLVCGERELVKAMVTAGLISNPEPPNSPTINIVTTQTQPVLRAGMPIYLERGIVEQLVLSGILNRLTAHCNVFIDTDEALEIRRETELAVKNERLRSQIEQLLQRLSTGQSTNKYQTHLHPAPNVPHEHGPQVTPEELCLYDALHFGETVGAPVCCDDRLLQTYQHTGKSAIVGIYDLLSHFKSKGLINDAAFFDWLHKLRVANLRYLPPTTPEILYQLRRAPIRNSQLEETPTLRSLRRAVAAMLLDRDNLQEVAVNEKGQHMLREMEFPGVCSRAISDALIDLWTGNESLDDIATRADWLWMNLFMDSRMLRQCFKSVQKPETDLQWLAMTIGLLYAQGLRLHSKRLEQNAVRQRYFSWITNRALIPVARNTPRLYEAVAQAFHDSMRTADEYISTASKKHGKNSPIANGLRVLVSQLVMDLPEQIRVRVAVFSDALERWGLNVQGPGVEISNMRFTLREYWTAVARALKSGGATMRSSDGRGKIRFSRSSKPNMLAVNKNGVTEIEILDLFHPEVERRRILLRSNPRWFDLDAAERNVAIEKVVSEKSPPDRASLLNSYRDESMANFYARLQAIFRETKALGIDDLMPKSPVGLLHFLRLPVSVDIIKSETWSDAATRLIASEGLEEAICRLSCLPVALPAAILSQYDALDGAGNNSLLNYLDGELKSFVQRLHLGRLWIRSAGKSNRDLEQLRALVTWVCDANKGGAEAKAFLAILHWVHLRLGWIEISHDWSPDLKLCAEWTHAIQLRNLLSEGGPPKETAEWFSEHCREINADQAGASTPYERDVCHPHNLDYGGLLIRGLAFIFEGASDEILTKSGVRESLSQALDQQGKHLTGGPSLWRPVNQQPNQLGSFLGIFREQFLSRLLTADSFKQHFNVDTGLDLQTALNMLQDQPANSSVWMVVEFLGGACSLNENQKQYVARALAKINFPDELKTNANLPELMVTTCQQATALGDATIRSNLREQIIELARAANAMSASAPTEPTKVVDWKRLGGGILDAIWKLNVVSGNPAATTNAFLIDAAMVFRAWPALATESGPWLGSVVGQLPVECQTVWLPTQLELRALG